MRFSFVALALLMPIFVACGSATQEPAPEAVEQPAEAATEVASDEVTESEVTLGQYEQINNDMTLAEVEAILGEGKEISRTEAEGLPTTAIYQWLNPDGTNITLTFQDDTVFSKIQFGLE